MPLYINNMTESKKRKIYIIGPGLEYINWMQATQVGNMDEADAVLFTGGEDVDPSMYDSPKNPRTMSNLKRDKLEETAYNLAKALGKPCIGICRGSQFLCVMSGGKLVQHQDNPLHIHSIDTFDNRTIDITSTHHQAQWPYSIPRNNYEILAWTKGISRMHEDGNSKELPLPMNKECEIVHYKESDCLAIQGHPEMMYRVDKNSETIVYMQDLLTKFLEKRIY